jgi:hypothetical protein
MMCKIALFIHTLGYGKDKQFDDFPARLETHKDFKPDDTSLSINPDFPDKAKVKKTIVHTGAVRLYFFLPVKWAW